MRKMLTVLAAMALVGFLALPVMAGSAGDMVDQGQAAVKAASFDGAIDLLTKAIKTKSLTKKELARAYDLRGQAYEAKSYWGDALEDYRRAVWNDRQNKDYQKNNHRMLRRQGSPN